MNLKNFFYSDEGLWIRYGFFSFIMIGSLGIITPFVPLWLGSIGFSVTQIGFVMALSQFFRFLIDPIAGSISDHTGNPKRISLIFPLLTLFSLYLILFFESFIWVQATFIAFVIACIYALQPIGDNISVHILARKNWPYGPLRSIGSIGFIILGFLAAFFFQKNSFENNLLIYVMMIIALIIFTTALFLPNIQTKRSSKKSFHSDFFRLEFILFLAAIFFVFHSNALLFVAAPDYWKNKLSFSHLQISMAWNISVFAEIIFFFMARKILKYVNPLQAMLISAFAAVIRWFILVYFDSYSMILLSSSLHGLTYGLFFASSILWVVDYYAPKGYAATGLGLMSSSIAIAFCTGMLYSGKIYDFYGASSWYISSFYAFMACLVLILLIKKPSFIKGW